MNLPPTYYQVVTDFPTCGFGNAGDPTTSFDDACDAFAEAMDDGQEALVFLIEPPRGKIAGMVTDVTDDAMDRVMTRIRCRPGYPEMPEWLEAAH